MKISLFKGSILLLLCTLIGVVVFFGWPHYVKREEDLSLTSVGRRANEITSAEVLRLTDTEPTGRAGSYFVRYNEETRGVASRHTLTGPQLAELVQRWNRLQFLEGMHAACHEPGFVLRFMVGQRVILEADVCFSCENVSWQSTAFTASCRQMAPKGFDERASTEALKTFLTGVAQPAVKSTAATGQE